MLRNYVAGYWKSGWSKGEERGWRGEEREWRGGGNGENVGLEYITGVKKRKELSEAEESEKKKFCS